MIRPKGLSTRAAHNNIILRKPYAESIWGLVVGLACYVYLSPMVSPIHTFETLVIRPQIPCNALIG